jgi:hypothetical protein
MFFTVEQEFPLWGKRDIKRVQAGAEVARTRADARMTEAELIEKVRVAPSPSTTRPTRRSARPRICYKAEVEITRLTGFWPIGFSVPLLLRPHL